MVMLVIALVDTSNKEISFQKSQSVPEEDNPLFVAAVRAVPHAENI
jgi:hypothetical protein